MRNKIVLSSKQTAEQKTISEIERVLLIEQRKRIGMAEVLNQNERESLKLKI